ncbi:type IV secretion system DNA-binding domain-containing protein [Patescibacteria group bacterium]|nr:type IV secretion system DNA-binding domain-containing protein [Patescibacteria group bacterium]
MNDEISVFAETTFRNQYKKFGIKTDDRRRHMYLIGKTGMGKSTIQENMIVGDIRAGHGLAVVDPHGDLAEKIIEYIPKERIKDVVYFNPSDMDFPIAFNVLEQVDPHLRHLVASGLLGVFQKLWADSWGPRLEYILRNAILAILDFPGSTLLGVVRMLSDKSYRKRVVANIKDPVVKAFWEKEFASYADKFASEAVSPIQNKVGQFLSSSLMRNIIGQVKSSINIREIMDEGKILIMNLSKGRIGEDNSALLGAMMITKIQLAAMSRVDMPEKERKDFYLYIDEFQNFSTDSFANILSEARKYHLNLILAHQYIEQLSEKVKPAVFGNVGTMISFRIGATDAEELAKEFAPVFTEEDLVNLPKYEMYLKLMIDGVASSPFSAKGLPPLTEAEKTNNMEKVIQYSREKYASARDEVEEKILRWHSAEDDVPRSTSAKPSNINISPRTNTSSFSPRTVNAPASTVRQSISSGNNERSNIAKKESVISKKSWVVAPDSDNRPTFATICARCGMETATIFEPDGIRPVFCKECLGIRRQEKKEEMEKRRQQKVEELKKVNNAPSISLSSLNQAHPVDFKGRPEKIREDKPTVHKIKLSEQEKEGDMDEDEIIDFSRRSE